MENYDLATRKEIDDLHAMRDASPIRPFTPLSLELGREKKKKKKENKAKKRGRAI